MSNFSPLFILLAFPSKITWKHYNYTPPLYFMIASHMKVLPTGLVMPWQAELKIELVNLRWGKKKTEVLGLHILLYPDDFLLEVKVCVV